MAKHVGMKPILLLAMLLGLGLPSLATDLELTVEALGCYSSAITVGPSCETSYRVVGVLSDAGSDGLAMVVFDIEFDGGDLSQAELPTGPPMSSFAPPDGLSNPDGYGGTLDAGKLLQVGGSQNVIGHGYWSCETDDDCPDPSTCVGEICTAISGLPLGVPLLGVAQPGAPVSIVTGTLTAPASPGTYTLRLTNPVGNVLEKGVDGRPYWWNSGAGVGTVAELTITVLAGEECCSAYDACCLPGNSCTMAPPAGCSASGGVTYAGEVCEQDLDGDGVGDICEDNCPGEPNPGQEDIDGDGIGDVCDNCPAAPNVGQTNGDGDTVGDACDNCPAVSNEAQTDSDLDAIGNACDICPFDPLDDADRDGFCGDVDNCPAIYNDGQRDSDASLFAEIRQWAVAATASSEYSPTDYGAIQATGAPEHPGVCTNSAMNWAPSTGGTDPEWLDLSYPTPIPAIGVSVHEALVGAFVYRIELRDTFGALHTVWESADTTACGGAFEPTWQRTDYSASGVVLHTMVNGWEEIDAVELIGEGPGSDPDGVGDACDNCLGEPNPTQDDQDVDGVGDLCDNCPAEPNPTQEDLDWDGVGDVCDNCPWGNNPGQGAAAFMHLLRAREYCSTDAGLTCRTDADCPGGACLKGVLEWPLSADYVYVVGTFVDPADIGLYEWHETGLHTGAYLTDPGEPSPGTGYWYLLKPDCPGLGSWQTVPGAEPQRDAALP